MFIVGQVLILKTAPCHRALARKVRRAPVHHAPGGRGLHSFFSV